MHTWHGTDFRENFQENCSISEKATYSTENSRNFGTKIKSDETSGYDISENLGELREVVSFCHKFWETLFHSTLENFKPGTIAMR